jgi:hypothetical protein
LSILSFSERLAEAVRLTTPDGRPNINELWMILKEVNAVKWSVKQNGYAIGRAVYEMIAALEVPSEPGRMDLVWKCSTQKDLESTWFRYWMSQLKVAPLPHRKLWEFAYILQSLHEFGLIGDGKLGIGFGCGEEPLPSFFASKGVKVLVTDLEPSEVAGRGWAETAQHASALSSAFKSELISWNSFEKNVSLRYVDMNSIPSDLHNSFDFCWSVCALEHLGSIRNGLDFILESVNVLKPGGVSIHTTEFSYTEEEQTIDNWPTVLFLRKHFRELSEKAIESGYRVFPINFDVGHMPLDNFIDLPPYDFPSFCSHHPGRTDSEYRPGHLKLSVDGFPSTCFGVIIQKPS